MTEHLSNSLMYAIELQTAVWWVEVVAMSFNERSASVFGIQGNKGTSNRQQGKTTSPGQLKNKLFMGISSKDSFWIFVML